MASQGPKGGCGGGGAASGSAGLSCLNLTRNGIARSVGGVRNLGWQAPQAISPRTTGAERQQATSGGRSSGGVRGALAGMLRKADGPGALDGNGPVQEACALPARRIRGHGLGPDGLFEGPGWRGEVEGEL